MSTRKSHYDQGLFAQISKVSLFGQDVTLLPVPNQPTLPKPPIAGYGGQSLFVTGFEVKDGVLVVTINDQGPPACAPAAPFPKQPTAATALISVGSNGSIYYPTTLTKTLDANAYNGGPVVMTGSVTPMTTPPMNADVKPVVAAWSNPSDDLSFVLVTIGGQTTLSWLADDIDLPTPLPTSAYFVPKPKGGGSLGPFGLGTP
jgi:hypothetical protein